MRDDEHGCLTLGTRPPDRSDVQCPYKYGADFLADCYRLRCTGRLFRSSIMDAERDSACCDKCFRHYGIELIEASS